MLLTETMNRHDVGRGRGGVDSALARVTARALVGGVDSDRLYPLAAAGGAGRRISRGAELRVIDSPYGHDGFLIEVDEVGSLLRELLAT